MRASSTCFWAGLIVLFVGALLYASVRPSESVALFQMINLETYYFYPESHTLKFVLGSLPSFLHVFSFSCLTFSLLADKSKANAIFIVISWSAVNVLTEIGQLAGKSSYCLAPSNFVDRYFCNGTFDFWDLVFSCIGGASALFFIIKYRRV